MRVSVMLQTSLGINGIVRVCVCRGVGGGSTYQRGLGISYTGGLGLCVGRHDGVKHGWRQPHDSPISGGGDKLTQRRVGGGVEGNTK